MNLPTVYAPNIHLFAFHRRHSLTGNSTEKMMEGAEKMWEKLNEILQKYEYDKPLDLWGYYPPKAEQAYDPSEEPTGRIVNLYENGILDFKGTVAVEEESVNFTGIACPRRMYDSYALALNIRRPEKEGDRPTEPVSISIYGQFNTPHCILLPDFIQSSLGQTLVLTADLTEEQKLFSAEDLKTIACQCIEEFIPNPQKRPEYNSKGRLFGSTIFEFGNLAAVESSSPYRHILVVFFREEALKKKFESSYWDIFELFYFKNKIIDSFKESRRFYLEIQEKYAAIEESIVKVDAELNAVNGRGKSKRFINLQRFKEQLKQMPGFALQYSRLQRDLERESKTIACDAKHYDRILQEIQEKQNLDVFYLKPIDLTFVANFTQKEVRYFQDKIKADLEDCKHGKQLLEQGIAAIHGIVEIEQADRNRQLETKIEAIAAGIGIATVIASSSSHFAENPIHFPYSPDAGDRLHPAIVTILISIVAGAIVYGCLSCILSWMRRKK